MVENYQEYKHIVESTANDAIDLYEKDPSRYETLATAIQSAVQETLSGFREQNITGIIAQSKTDPDNSEYTETWRDLINNTLAMDNRGVEDISSDALFFRIAKTVLTEDVTKHTNSIINGERVKNNAHKQQLERLTEDLSISPHSIQPKIILSGSLPNQISVDGTVIKQITDQNINIDEDTSLYLLSPTDYSITRKSGLMITDTEEEYINMNDEEVFIKPKHINCTLIVSAGNKDPTIPETTTNFFIY